MSENHQKLEINASRQFVPWLALRDGKARYVTATSQSDLAEGWREQRQKGGCVIDIHANEIIATGLSMP